MRRIFTLARGLLQSHMSQSSSSSPPSSSPPFLSYYGRPYEAKGKTKGGAFDAADKEYLRFVLGKTSMIPALEEALSTMKPGGIRQVGGAPSFPSSLLLLF